jgi:hypothetical protein
VLAEEEQEKYTQHIKSNKFKTFGVVETVDPSP